MCVKCWCGSVCFVIECSQRRSSHSSEQMWNIPHKHNRSGGTIMTGHIPTVTTWGSRDCIRTPTGAKRSDPLAPPRATIWISRERLGLQQIRRHAHPRLTMPLWHPSGPLCRRLYGSINTKQDSQSSFQTFAQLNSILGFHMKPSKERRPASQHKIQGAIIQCHTVKACPNRIQRLLHELHSHLHTDSMSPDRLDDERVCCAQRVSCLLLSGSWGCRQNLSVWCWMPSMMVPVWKFWRWDVVFVGVKCYCRYWEPIRVSERASHAAGLDFSVDVWVFYFLEDILSWLSWVSRPMQCVSVSVWSSVAVCRQFGSGWGTIGARPGCFLRPIRSFVEFRQWQLYELMAYVVSVGSVLPK